MEFIKKTILRLPIFRPFIQIIFLLSLVLVVNHSVIAFNLMYPEQPTIYLANQGIHSLGDLLNIYLHPKLLHTNIPFFRPSGHFLIYQIITPLLGWHNTKAFILINLFFLSMTGYFLIRLYSRLFPSYRFGGWVAFSIYLMHPALSISRLTIMHFEFAYVFFLTLSLYLFVVFCEKNTLCPCEREHHPARIQPDVIPFRHYFLFFASLFLYVLAVTFKEPAVMLGPVLMCYFLIHFYTRQSPWRYLYRLAGHRDARKVITIITLTSAALGIYLLASWPGLEYGVKNVNYRHTLGTVNAFLKDVFGVTHDYIPSGILAFPDLAWRTIIFTASARLLIWALIWAALLGTLGVWIYRSDDSMVYKKSLAFLYASSILFLVLPFSWAMGAPWHYSLTLLCLSVIAGFCVERLAHKTIGKYAWVRLLCLSLSFCILCVAFDVNRVNIDKYASLANGSLGLALNRNAVLRPPAIKSRLNPDSLLVIEDSLLHNDYLMGNSAYPFLLFLGSGEYELLENRQKKFYLSFHHTYSGTLFRYAYLMPGLKEEVYPFQIERMEEVPNEILYNWLLHYNNIFAFGYDKQGVWYDKSQLFKQRVLKEESSRRLRVNAYHSFRAAMMPKMASYIRQIPVPDEQLCRFTCDQDESCRGFLYQNTVVNQHVMMQCYFYESAFTPGDLPCKDCLAFVKEETKKPRVLV
ncbi:hypothetical protein AQUSIP_23280 [Aquicella siphonis]|uniref:Glycosyltransferase RgtA/B/C/D-like domain-containing protein n=1 Tax=Aquicella siphonis TaxID=254247 RepID=A0A5E4PKQ2_9COXI|nr:hypothetical protein [Aquicella siphonis]VVC77001.1 hypothetical protein AQUSIP_23280 [Aquicella siphonis]